VEAKVAGREPAAPDDEPVQVIELLEALKQSVAAAEKDAPSGAKKGKTTRRKGAKRRRSA
jgi:non-homologous end joining protein Ku